MTAAPAPIVAAAGPPPIPAAAEESPLVAAIDALLRAGARDEAARLLTRYGPELQRSGHAAAVGRFEAELGGGTPAVQLMRARALALQDAASAQAAFLGAHAAAVAAGDDTTAIRAASGVLHTIFKAWDNFRLLPGLLPFAERALSEPERFPDPGTALECQTGLLFGWLLTRPGDPRNAELAERMFAALADPGIPPAARLDAAGVLLAQCELTGNTGRGQAMVRLLAPDLDNEAIPLEHRLTWSYEATLFQCLQMAPDSRVVADAIARHRARLVPGVGTAHRFRCARLEFEAACNDRDDAAAERALVAMHQTQDPTLPSQAIILAHREATLALGLGAGHGPRALAAARRAVEEAERVGVPEVTVAVYRLNVVHALVACGDYDEAGRQAQILVQGAPTRHRHVYQTIVRMLPVLAAFARAEDPSAAIRELLSHMATVDYYRSFSFQRAAGARAMAFALARGILPDVAKKVIATVQFEPPPDLPEAWPWAVRIRLFGTPELEVDGDAAGSGGKAQQRPFELLQLLAISGAEDEAGADSRALSEALWPDAESDPKAAFDVVLMRLRKLLRHDGVITVADGRVRFDRQRVWCDVWAFTARVNEAGRATEARLDDLFSLYRGPLLGEGTPPAWAISRREQLRTRFLRAVAEVGAAAEAAGQWRTAAALYERGIEQDTLAEDLYAGLMRCHLALDEPANALRAYRRCRELLSIVLGVAPGAETEAIRARIPGR